MRLIPAVLSILCVALVFAQSTPQNRPQHNDLYSACFDRMLRDPEHSVEICRKYLAASPKDNPDHFKQVEDWVANYDRVQPYVRFLEDLTMEPSGRWLVYQPDTTIDLPQTSQMQGRFQMEISRSFAAPTEEFLLRQAEATYPGTRAMIHGMLRNGVLCDEDFAKEKAPLWGSCGNDNIEEADVVTARAVRYYYDLTMMERQNPRLSSGFTAEHSDMKYDADIKFMSRYTHKKDSFANVYVANLTLKWGFQCGGLCGVGWTRKKVVVLDSSGNVLAMYLDAPENDETWVS